MEKKIVQLMALPGVVVDSPSPHFTEANDTNTANITWHVVGAALMDDGSVSPLCYDGFWGFKTIDRKKRQLIGMTEKALQDADEAARIEKNGYPAWMDEDYVEGQE